MIRRHYKDWYKLDAWDKNSTKRKKLMTQTVTEILINDIIIGRRLKCNLIFSYRRFQMIVHLYMLDLYWILKNKFQTPASRVIPPITSSCSTAASWTKRNLELLRRSLNLTVLKVTNIKSIVIWWLKRTPGIKIKWFLVTHLTNWAKEVNNWEVWFPDLKVMTSS